jgi:DNA-binding transcriptional MerR regulator
MLIDSVRLSVYNTVMKNGESLWTIDQLALAVAAALAEGYGGPPNGRVRDVPDQRTVRYYTTLGLIDRPVEMRGRTALYGRRHLLQLVAIKKLQASGRSLAQVQQALAGQTDLALARFAGLDDGATSGPGGNEPAGRGARDFWREEPAPLATCDSEESTDAGRQMEDRPKELISPTVFHGVPLVDGVTLLLASSRPIDAEDLEAIRAAAAPLIGTLTHRQLIRSSAEGESP